LARGAVASLVLTAAHAALAAPALHVEESTIVAAPPATVWKLIGDYGALQALAAQLAEEAAVPLVLDADALNLLARESRLQQAVAARHDRQVATLLTPHPSEAARLLASDTALVQADRAGAAREMAARYRALVVLKGCGSVIATPDGRWFVNTTGNPGLASAGTGDVLSGLIVALLAQGWPALEALLAAVHVHGAAADQRVADHAAGAGGAELEHQLTHDAADLLE